MDTGPVLAERTASIELAGEADKAITAKPEALEPGVYNEVGREREVETSPQEDKQGPKARPHAGRPERRLFEVVCGIGRGCLGNSQVVGNGEKASQRIRE